MKFDLRRIGLAIAAPALAIVVALALTSLILLVAGDPVLAVWQVLFKAPLPRQMVAIVNEATVLYLSAVAVAIGFKMNLFNIGVDGQYRIASFAAAVFAGAHFLPGWLNIIVSIVVAMVTGALWASIAGFLKVGRGVSEVISTIMLNYIATYLVAYLLKGAAVKVEGSNATSTRVLAEDSRVPGIDLSWLLGTGRQVYGLIFLAILVGVLFWFVLAKTRFGFDLRATGQSETAAVASGVNVKRMIVVSMILSGAIAGLVGMPLLFGQDYAYGDTVQAGLGFAGMSVALLGRNHPIGMAVSALLWGYLNQLSNGLQISAGVSDRLVLIIQGIIVLSVVIAYEVVRRAGLRMEQRRVARELAEQPGPATEGVAA
jgi:simple sugar transport system permease protein